MSLMSKWAREGGPGIILPREVLDYGQEGWLRYRKLKSPRVSPGPSVRLEGFENHDPWALSAKSEWEHAAGALFDDRAAGGVIFTHDASLSPEEAQLACESARQIHVRAGSSRALIYGTFRLIRAIQCGEVSPGWSCRHVPAISTRVWMHFDNVLPKVDIERGYGGETLWKWALLPEDPGGRYAQYARMLASIGINGLILNNVNAGEPVLGGWRLITEEWIPKVAMLASFFRPWGIRVGLCIAYNAPQLSGELSTSHPLDPAVQDWWKRRAASLYAAIPDFLGWVIKADSEGQAGPMGFGLDHAAGSRHLAEALAPHGGRLFWRCFVYGHERADITAQPYRQFVPLDGQFPENVTLLIKNGPRDFQVREPLHPLFGALPKTSCSLELQATQEYLGHDTHAVFLPSQWEEIFALPTHDGSALHQWLARQPGAAIVGVANTNDAPNWTGHLFAQANWYGFGRIAWDPSASARVIAKEWAMLAFDANPVAVKTTEEILLGSYRAFEGYTAPFCLGQIYNTAKTWDSDHYDPDPWRNNGTDWFYAGPDGAGFPRASGEFFAQYPPAFRERVADPRTCDENYLLWFHRLPWDWKMKDGRTLLEALRHRYESGADQVDEWIAKWVATREHVDPVRHTHVLDRLLRQRLHARLWARYMITYLESQAGQATPAA